MMARLLLICLLLSSLMTSISGGESLVTIARLTYDGRPPAVTYIEKDMSRRDSFLYSTTTNMYRQELSGLQSPPPVLLAGDKDHKIGYKEGRGTLASFLDISAFTQINSTITIIVDSDNHCLRSLNTETGQTTLVAGNWRKQGFMDGQLLTEAKFDTPIGISYHKRDIYITDFQNKAVRTIKDGEDSVSTVLKGEMLGRPWGITFNPYTDDDLAYITSLGPGFGLLRLNIKTGLITRLSGSTSVTAKTLSSAAISNARHIAFFSKTILLLIELNRNRLIVADLNKDMIGYICSQQRELKDGDIRSCGFDHPHSLVVTKRFVYLGEQRAIRRLPVEAIYEALQDSTGATNDADSLSSICPKDQSLLLSQNQVTTELTVGHVTITLNEGHHELNTTLANGQSCSWNVDVLGPAAKPIRNAIAFRAIYQFRCSALTDEAIKLFRITATSAFQDILQICPDCRKPATTPRQLIITCAINQLSIIWMTEKTVPLYQLDLEDHMNWELNAAVAKQQKVRGKNYFATTIKYLWPTRIFPIRNSNRLVLEPMLRPVCAEPLVYKDGTNACERP